MRWMAPLFDTSLAAAEPDTLRKDLFLQLAQAENSHAQLASMPCRSPARRGPR
jgi:hypothetical protein